jgi:hypothetical protein
MYTPADKSPENSPASQTARSAEQNATGGSFEFFDNRPEAVAQRKFLDAALKSPQHEKALQLQAMADKHCAQQPVVQKKENRTGLPGPLKSGVEQLSGYSMDDVKVHYNSDKPAKLQAHAYAQGTDIHIAPGQEKHLPHEAWHVVQQKQNRVKPTLQLKGAVPVNDDAGLEKEADIMGTKALNGAVLQPKSLNPGGISSAHGVAQRALVTDTDILKERTNTYNWTSFRGKRTNLFSGRATEAGRGAKLTTGASKNTEVEWDPLDVGSGEGKKMEARIGPDHNLGSRPTAANAAKRVKAFADLSGEDYISGHLMNEKLGGPGDDGRNLTAISGSANGLQSTNIEDHVRNPVNERGAWMYYKVEVDYTDDSKRIPTDDANLQAALLHGAPGLTATPSSKKGYSRVNVRYASKLTAQWYPLDDADGMADRATNVSISIDSPLAPVGGKATASAPRKTGAASGKAAIKTDILAEELVLTKSDLLKHIVDNRIPLSKRIQHLEISDQESQDARVELLRQAAILGKQVGFAYAYSKELAANNLTLPLTQFEQIDEQSYQLAFTAGALKGRIEGQKYVQGYYDGGNDGWGDDPKLYRSQEAEYIKGYDRGHQKGLESGDYSKGKRYSFDRIAVLPNIYEYNQNVFRHLDGSLFLELTGNYYTQPNGPRWYQVKLVGSGNQYLRDEVGTVIGWMKRKWLNKGF